MREDLIERLRAFVVERGKLACGSDIVSACNNSALSLADLRALLAALEAAREDSARLDALDAMILESDERALLLHHGLHEPKDQGFCGLGLGNTGRSLRAAIDQARGKGGGEVG